MIGENISCHIKSIKEEIESNNPDMEQIKFDVYEIIEHMGSKYGKL